MKRKIRIKQSVPPAVAGIDLAQEDDTSTVAVFTDARTGKPVALEASTAWQGVGGGGRAPNIPPMPRGGFVGEHLRNEINEMAGLFSEARVSATEAARGFRELGSATSRIHPHYYFDARIHIDMDIRTLTTLVTIQVRVRGDDSVQFSAEACIPDEAFYRAPSLASEESVSLLREAARQLARCIGFWGVQQAMRAYRPECSATAEIARLVSDIASRELR